MAREYKPYILPTELQLKDYQKDGVKFLQSHWEAILADEMGLGKTVTMLMSIKDWIDKQNMEEQCKQKRCLIITPASLQWTWVREIQRWFGEENFYDLFPRCGDSCIQLDTYENLDKWILHEKGRRALVVIWNIDMVLFDEAHYLKNPSSKRHFYAKEVSKRCTYIYLLTGTPMSSGPKDLAALLDVMWQLDTFGGYKTFYRKYCDPSWNGFGYDYSGASNQEELHEKLKPYLLRRTKQSVGLKLPPKTVKNICVGSMEQEYASTFEEMEDYSRMVNKEKFPLAVNFIDNLLTNGKRPVIFVHHKSLLKKFVNKYKDKCVAIYGGQSKDERQKSVDRFQAGEIPIIICSLMASAVGLTLTSSDTAVFLEYLWSPDISKQAEDRIHRLSQTKPCTIYNLYMNYSIEQQKLLTIYAKQLRTEGIL